MNLLWTYFNFQLTCLKAYTKSSSFFLCFSIYVSCKVNENEPISQVCRVWAMSTSFRASPTLNINFLKSNRLKYLITFKHQLHDSRLNTLATFPSSRVGVQWGCRWLGRAQMGGEAGHYVFTCLQYRCRVAASTRL